MQQSAVDNSEPEFLNFYGAKEMEWFEGNNSTSLCSLAGRYDNPIPNRFLTPIDCFKIPALVYHIVHYMPHIEIHQEK
jgi:hypothetical protein